MKNGKIQKDPYGRIADIIIASRARRLAELSAGEVNPSNSGQQPKPLTTVSPLPSPISKGGSQT